MSSESTVFVKEARSKPYIVLVVCIYLLEMDVHAINQILSIFFILQLDFRVRVLTLPV